MEMLWMEWVASAFSRLAGRNNELLQKLWKERKLQFNSQNQILDLVDKYSVQLICEALDKRESLFIALPDNQIYRPAFLFATAVIQSWLDLRQNYASNRTILYFGATIGIREQLRNTAINNISLSEVFKQQDLGKRNIKASSVPSRSSPYIPQIVTIYGPADPAKVLQKYKPIWIGVDCGDAARLEWLEPLLKIATERKVPVIGWGHNPLSESLSQFAKYGLIFRWPVQIWYSPTTR